MSQARKTTVRVIVASFIAGASAMALVGLVGPIAANGGLSLREALAAQVEQRPSVQLDVAAVRARLASAERDLETARASTADEINRLDRLAGR